MLRRDELVSVVAEVIMDSEDWGAQREIPNRVHRQATRIVEAVLRHIQGETEKREG